MFPTEYDACRRMELKYHRKLRGVPAPSMVDLCNFWPGNLVVPVVIYNPEAKSRDGEKYVAWYTAPKTIWTPWQYILGQVSTLIHEFAHHVCYHERLKVFEPNVSNCHAHDFVIVNEFLIISYLINTGRVDERRLLKALKISNLEDFLVQNLKG